MPFEKNYTLLKVLSGLRGEQRSLEVVGMCDLFTDAVVMAQGLISTSLNNTDRLNHEERSATRLRVVEYHIVYTHPAGWLMTVAEFSITV